MHHAIADIRILIVVVLLSLMGCTKKISVAPTPLPPLPESATYPLRATLILSQALCTYTHRYNKSRSIYTWVYPLGPILCSRAEAIVRESFINSKRKFLIKTTMRALPFVVRSW